MNEAFELLVPGLPGYDIWFYKIGRVGRIVYPSVILKHIFILNLLTPVFTFLLPVVRRLVPHIPFARRLKADYNLSCKYLVKGVRRVQVLRCGGFLRLERLTVLWVWRFRSKVRIYSMLNPTLFAGDFALFAVLPLSDNLTLHLGSRLLCRICLALSLIRLFAIL